MTATAASWETRQVSFLDPSLTDAQRKKAQEQIRALAPITELREIKPTDVLEKDIFEARR